jgi:ACS family hexuronate transporter-like MFS transporter
MFPKNAVSSVTGIGGMAGAIGGMLIAQLASRLLEHFKSLGDIKIGYYIMFIICGIAYLLAWTIMFKILIPKMKPIEIKD